MQRAERRSWRRQEGRGELRGAHGDAHALVIGSTTRLADLTGGVCAELAPGLAHAALSTATPQVRNMGTIGGNVMSALPFRNLLAVLLALDAQVELASSDGCRVLP